jgi:hypothetical protein
MTIQQTFTIPQSRRLDITLPETFTPGTKVVFITIPADEFFTVKEEHAMTTDEAIDRLYGISAGSGGSVDDFLARRYADMERECEQDEQRRQRLA